DGIRDFHVTGVQTCALPIWKSPSRWSASAQLAAGHATRFDVTALRRRKRLVEPGNVALTDPKQLADELHALAQDCPVDCTAALEIGRASCRDSVYMWDEL